MSDVLEGWVKANSEFGPLSTSITSYSGDWTSSDNYLYLFLYKANGERQQTLGYYNKRSGGWSLNTAGVVPPLRSEPYDVVLIDNSTQEEILRRRVLFNAYGVECPFYPLTTPLATPTGLYADNITSNSARVSWSEVANASGYKVEYRQSAGGGQTYPWVEAQN